MGETWERPVKTISSLLDCLRGIEGDGRALDVDATRVGEGESSVRSITLLLAFRLRLLGEGRTALVEPESDRSKSSTSIVGILCPEMTLIRPKMRLRQVESQRVTAE